MLAIVIPYYKITFFEETLKSLANQTDKRFKVYIGNDASSEDPAFLLNKYKGSFNFEYINFKNNLGSVSLVKQWERCARMIQGEEWLMILGDDDFLTPRVVEYFYKKLPEFCNVKVIRYSTQNIDKDGKDISEVIKHPVLEKASIFIIKKIKRLTRSSLSEYIFSKAKVLEIGFKDFPLAWYSDDLAILEFSSFKEILTINEAIIKIRISEASISGSNKNKHLKDKAKFSFYWTVYNKYLKQFSTVDQQFIQSIAINSFFNRISLINYFIIIKCFLIKGNINLIINLNIRLLILIKAKLYGK